MDCFTAEYSKAANFLGLEQFQDGIAPSEKSPPRSHFLPQLLAKHGWVDRMGADLFIIILVIVCQLLHSLFPGMSPILALPHS